ncbi:MAG: YibE/F family protein [Nitriliruptoraceae bacterium]
MRDLGSRTHRRLIVVVAVLAALTIAGIVWLWPQTTVETTDQAGSEQIFGAEIRSVQSVGSDVDPISGGRGELLLVSLKLIDGPEAGEVVSMEVLGEGYPDFAIGDEVAVSRISGDEGQVDYYIADFERRRALLLLVGAFVVAVLLVSRFSGLRALIGLAVSLFIVVSFVVPAILAGQQPALVAWVGAMAVMLVTLYLTHGMNEMTTAAIIGTAASLTFTVAIGMFFIERSKITGFASDDAVFARFAVEGLDLQGLVLAGLIIAALGVLDDVTVSQASTVFALHDTDRRLSWGMLFGRAMKVGRDHIASVVNTLFLAYAGASLALLVLFTTSGARVGEIVNSEIIAEEIVKTVVGSLGLVAAVPLTTALAAALAIRRAPNAPAAHGMPAGGPSPGVGRARLRRLGRRTDDELYARWLASLRDASASPDIEDVESAEPGDAAEPQGPPPTRSR